MKVNVGKSRGSRVYVLFSVLIVLLLLFASAPPILPIASAEDAVEPEEVTEPPEVLNQPPIAGDDAYNLEKGGTLEVPAPGVLANDTDPEGDPLTAIILIDPAYGTLALNPDGSFTYIHDGGDAASDSFTYKASDGTSESNIATVTLTIVAPNSPPVTADDAFALDEGGTLEVPAPAGILANDTDAEGEALTALMLTDPAHGTLTLNADGSFTYVHDGSETLSDSFTYKASDGKSDLNSAVVTFTMSPVNDPPVASDDSYSLEGCKAFEVSAPGVLANDSDSDGDPLTATKLTDPAYGTLTLNPDGSFTYTCLALPDLPGPASGTTSFAADTETQSEPVVDSFTYSVSDGKADSNVATVTITIEPGETADENTTAVIVDHNLKKVTATVAPDRDTQIESYGGKMKLSIPKDALDQETEIEITDHGQWGPKAGGMLNVFEFNAFANEKVSGELAEGQDTAAAETSTRTQIKEFKKGLNLSIQHTPEELAGLDIDTLKLYYLDETTRQWMPVASSKFDEKTGLLTATIEHFSYYGENAQPAIMGPGKVKAFQVDLHSGAAVSSYPIEVPPGSGGFQPSISLVYNSASVDEMKNKRSVGSWVGTGWSLGLGAVSYDAENSEYSLAFSGGSYKLAQDVQGAYHTIPESFYKITKTGQQWDVYDREGIYYRFGGTTESQQYYDSSTYYRWDLSYMRDTNTANTITVTYVQDVWTDPSTGKTHVRSAYPSHVYYNNNHVDIVFSSSYDAEVSGNGRLRNDNPRDPKPKVIENRKLDSIEVKVDGNLVRKYIFAYTTTAYWRSTDYGGIDYSGKHTLTSIKEYGADGTSQLPTMSLTYTDLQTRLYDTNETTYSGNPGNPAEFSWPHLTSVTNGYGATITYAYTQKPSSSTNDIWTREAVTTLTTNPGIGTSVTTGYTYTGNPQYFKRDSTHEWSDEYRGFSQVRATDAQGNYTDHYFYTTGDISAEILTGKEFKTEWFNSSSQLLERKEYTWGYSNAMSTRPTNGLLAYWAFNEGSGSTAYDSAGTNHGTISGATWTTGKYGSALSFDGVNDYVDYGNGSVFNFGNGTDDSPFTLEAWVKRADLSVGGEILSKYNSQASPHRQQYSLGIYQNGGVEFALFDTSNDWRKGITATDPLIADYGWHHVIATYDGSETVGGLNIYIDGSLASSTVTYDSASYVAMEPTTESLKIGMVTWSTGPAWYFKGSIDEVRVYDHALSEAEARGGAFIYLSQVTDTIGSKVSRTSYTYDDYGNVVKELQEGDTSTSDDDLTVWRAFYPNTSANILSKPARERVYAGAQATDDGGSNLKKESLFYYDGNNTSLTTPPTVGNLTRLESKVGDGNSVSSYFTYDSYGNVLTETDPKANVWTTNYESTYHIFPAKIIAPANSGSETYSFDPKTGNLLTRTDVNGQTTSYEYDTFGRLTKAIQPGDSSSSPSMKYEYNNWGTLNQQHLKALSKVAEGDYLWSAQFFDGLGRVIQTQSRGETGRTIIASTTTYNNRGLVDKQYVSQDVATETSGCNLPTGPVAYWAFNEGSGNTAYDSAGTNNGTIYGAAWTTGKNGSGLSFDGVDDYVNCGTTLQLPQQFTLEGWVKISDFSKKGSLLYKGHPTLSGWCVYGVVVGLYNGPYFFISSASGSDSQDVYAQNTMNTDQWHHIAAVQDTTTRRVYVDGTLRASESGVLTPGTSSDPLWIGNTDEDGKLKGIVDEVHIYNRALSAEDVYALYTGGVCTPAYKTPESSWKYSTSTYDALGRVTQTTAADGTTTSTDYSVPWQTTVTNEQGYKHKYYYDAFGRLTQVDELNASHALYATTTYGYDTLGNLKQVIDAQSHTTTMNYDWLSRKTSMTDPDMGAWSYGYDASGNLTSQTDNKSQTITLSYDALNRLTGKTYPAGSGMTNITYTYDSTASGNYGKGRRTSMTDASGTTAYTYDARGRLIQEKRTISSVDYTTGFAYDAGDRLQTVTYPTGETVAQTYNSRGFPSTLTGSATGNLVTGVQYNQLGQMTQINLGNGAQTIYGYWGVGGTNDNTGGYYGRLWRIKTSKDGTDRQNITHTWDAGGNLTQRQDTVASETETFGYDFLDRLTSVSGAYTQSYAYDQIGNISTMNGTSYTYGTRPHAVTAVGNASYTYDANGNMTARGAQTLTWDVENKVSQVNTGTSTATFVYDSDGNRVKKTEGGETTVYVNQYYEKNLSTSEVTTHYFLGGKEIAYKRGSELRYPLDDHLFSSAGSMDSSGNKVATVRYFPFGGTRFHDGDLGFDKMFTGQRLDDTGLYYYGARYYDATIGRFISPDTIVPNPANPQSLNRYSYCLNNPLKYFDPTGHQWSVPSIQTILAYVAQQQAAANQAITQAQQQSGAATSGSSGSTGGSGSAGGSTSPGSGTSVAGTQPTMPGLTTSGPNPTTLPPAQELLTKPFWDWPGAKDRINAIIAPTPTPTPEATIFWDVADPNMRGRSEKEWKYDQSMSCRASDEEKAAQGWKTIIGALTVIPQAAGLADQGGIGPNEVVLGVEGTATALGFAVAPEVTIIVVGIYGLVLWFTE